MLSSRSQALSVLRSIPCIICVPISTTALQAPLTIIRPPLMQISKHILMALEKEFQCLIYKHFHCWKVTQLIKICSRQQSHCSGNIPPQNQVKYTKPSCNITFSDDSQQAQYQVEISNGSFQSTKLIIQGKNQKFLSGPVWHCSDPIHTPPQ